MVTNLNKVSRKFLALVWLNKIYVKIFHFCSSIFHVGFHSIYLSIYLSMSIFFSFLYIYFLLYPRLPFTIYQSYLLNTRLLYLLL